MNVLSYNNKTTGEGWITLNGQYNADEIEQISDPNGGLSAKPRTAIPSPFAQMDLVKNAFKRLSMHPNLKGELMDERLVSNALDIAQLFFNYTELSNRLKIIVWNRQTEVERLKSDPQHRLLGETIEMFLEQDKEAFNFDQLDKLFFLVSGDKVIGSTSPVTLWMATPNAKEDFCDIPVEQNVNLFQTWRPLYQRQEKFIKYVYALFTAFPDLKKNCGEVNAYLITNLPLLDSKLQAEIINEIGNPRAVDLQATEKARTWLDTNFDMLDNGVKAIGVPFYCVRRTDIQAAISKSDFVIRASREQDDRLPLVLQNHLNALEPFRYITGPWDDATIIRPEDYAPVPEKRILPATSHQYPWLTTEDFLQPVLIKLDYTLDNICFFNGNRQQGSRDADDHDFLLPLKPLFFKYFNAEDLRGTISGRPRFELIHSKIGGVESVRVILRIPVQKAGQFVTLERTYIQEHDMDLRYDEKNDRGVFLTLPFTLTVFPFVRLGHGDAYKVQLVDRSMGMLSGCSLQMDFAQNGYKNYLDEQKVVCRQRSLKAEKHIGSDYYSVSDSFDYMQLRLIDDHGGIAAEGIVCPNWPDYVPGHEALTFSVDFGTTNTHVEFMAGEKMPAPLSMNSEARQRLLATLYNGNNVYYDALMKQEFLPKALGEDYGFPQRTVLSEPDRLDAETVDEIVALGDANIPFVYEKESLGYANRVVANLKWSTDLANSKRVKAYLTELALLMRTKVLLENGDLQKTRLVWFYPLAMKVGNVRKIGETWSKIFRDVFNVQPDSDNLIQMPESVAPYYFYKSSSRFLGAASTVASIDIGGGSSDVVVFGSNAQQPSFLTSFRFAANVLFGDGFSEVPHGDSNPMLIKYVEHFRKHFEHDDETYGELSGILEDITEKKKSEDINAFLFSVINNKVVKGKDVFSYNLLLNQDGERKIIFIYFYVTLIYYVASMMKHRGLEKPRSVMFSGTGSKVLDIVGSQRDLDQLTQAVFERVYGEKYDVDGFSVVMEKKEPKQITCRGALMQVRESRGCAQVAQLNKMMDSFDSKLIYNYSMIGKEKLVYDDMDNPEIRQEIIDQVKKYNDFFCKLCDDVQVVDRFLVDYNSLLRFKELVNKNLEHHLVNGWNFVNRNTDTKNGSDEIEDTMFFYPIIGSIRENLIQNL